MTIDQISTAIAPRFTTIDGVRIRYAESGPSTVDAILLSPWPETVYAFDQVWSTWPGTRTWWPSIRPASAHPEAEETC